MKTVENFSDIFLLYTEITVFVTCLFAVTKYSDKNNIRKGWFILPNFPGTTVHHGHRSRQWSTAHSVRKQSGDACSPPALSF